MPISMETLCVSWQYSDYKQPFNVHFPLLMHILHNGFT
uniref:Uncharacterized protein n=1 Tax=Anguilla anguilla TaxID=7936 RepID=A0A0E9U6Z8_ANGAN